MGESEPIAMNLEVCGLAVDKSQLACRQTWRKTEILRTMQETGAPSMPWPRRHTGRLMDTIPTLVHRLGRARKGSRKVSNAR